MAKQLKLKAGSTSEHIALAGKFSEGELTYDTTLKQIRVHDGSQAGYGQQLSEPIALASAASTEKGITSLVNRLDVDREDALLTASMGLELKQQQLLATTPIVKGVASGSFNDFHITGTTQRGADGRLYAIFTARHNLVKGDKIWISYRSGSSNTVTTTSMLTVDLVTNAYIVYLTGAVTGATTQTDAVMHCIVNSQDNIKVVKTNSRMEATIEFLTPLTTKNYYVIGYCRGVSRESVPLTINPQTKTVNSFTVSVSSVQFSYNLDGLSFVVYA